MSWFEQQHDEVMIQLESRIQLCVQSWPVGLEDVLEHLDVLQIQISIVGQGIICLEIHLIHGGFRSASIDSVKRMDSLVKAIRIA